MRGKGGCDGCIGWMAVAAAMLIVAAAAAGCLTFTSHKAGNNPSVSGGDTGGTGGGMGGGTKRPGSSPEAGSGSTGGSGGPYTVVADKDHMKVYYSVACEMKRVQSDSTGTDIQTARIMGDVPLRVDRSWDRPPAIDSDQTYTGAFESEGGAMLTAHAEWDHQCKSGACIPCHVTFTGPVWLNPGLQHKAADPATSWYGVMLVGTTTLNALSNHEMGQYVQMDQGCPGSADTFATGLVEGQIQSCFTTSPGSYDWTPVAFSDGSTITFVPSDEYTTLDSKAVFHISG